MRTSCPSCLSQNEHSHSEKQVLCSSCGETYSPFLTPQENKPAEISLGDFSESALAFQEIVDFGQSMDTAPAPTNEKPEMVKPVVMPTVPKDFIFTSTDLGPLYKITQWHPLQSRLVVLGDDSNPLEKALQDLKEKAQELGANALVGIRCSLCPDNRRALVLGTPVLCAKNQ